MSLMDIIMVGIAGMIGGAIFVLTGPAIGLAGSAVILVFIINATITLFLQQWHTQSWARQCRKQEEGICG